MKKISKIVLSFAVFLLGMSFVSVASVRANSGNKEITIRGTVGLEFIDWNDSYKFNIFMNEIEDSNNSSNTTVDFKNRKFEFKVQIPYGSTKKFNIGQAIPADVNSINGVAYDENQYHITIGVTDEGIASSIITVDNNSISKETIGDIINLDQIGGIGTTFKNKYTSLAGIIAGTSTTIKDGTWDKGTKLSYSFSEDFNSNGTIGSVWTQQENLGKEDFSFGSNLYMHANETRIEHRYIKKVDTNIKSVISDPRVYEVWYKIIDHGDGTNEIWHSFDGEDFVIGNIADVSFEDIYFKRAIEVEYDNGDTNEATFELYEYTDGDASMSNASKLFVDEFIIKDGKLSIDVKEGKYFFVEKVDQEVSENKIYSFDVTRENYTDKLVFQINKQEVEHGTTEEVNDSNATIVERSETGIKTSDDNNLMLSILVMFSALCGVLYFGKKLYANKCK